MKPNTSKALFIALFGAGIGLLIAFVVMLFGIGQPNSSGDRGIIGTVFCWLSWPVGWLAEIAAQRGIVNRENIPVMIVGMCVYWSLLAAVVAVLTSYFSRKFFRHHQQQPI